MTTYTATIGLEVHAELKTKTKLFCNSKNDPDEVRPNVNICPVCTGHPGVLPVINMEAIGHVVRVGYAVGAKIADYTEFDRKNYFYPDIPKGYQISQYAHPIVSGGELSGVAITRVHLEEDTARSTHKTDSSLVDFNRAGVPLMELVTEPVMHSSEEVGRFARELQLLLRYLSVSDANMEKGEMRVEANISISKSDKSVLGTKVEVKNLNSFKAMERAIEYEIKRQEALLLKGEAVIQETRGWDDTKQKTFSQRLKEESHDYRYFPDPDIPKFKFSEIKEFAEEKIKENIPELPWERRLRYIDTFGLKKEDAEMYVRNAMFGNYFEKVAKELEGEPALLKLATNYISSDLAGLYQDQKEIGIPHEAFSDVIKMIRDGDLSSRGAKDLLGYLSKSDGDPKAMAEEKGLIQKSDEGELKEIVRQIIDENEKVVEDYKNGKESSLQFLIGQGMKLTKGSANPATLKQLLEAEFAK